MVVILSTNFHQEREKDNFPKSLKLSASSIVADTCLRSLSVQTVHRDRDFTERWLIRDFCFIKKKEKKKASCHLCFLYSDNRSSWRGIICVCTSLNVREILTGNTKRKSVRAARQCGAMRWRESYFSLHSHATVGFLDHADIVSSIP